jgi:hypothetical protein
MSKVEVNTVEPQCGTTLTLGGSGDTVALGSGASQTGFGRTGTVDWVTTPKVTGDSPVTAVTGKGYFLNTTAGTITINLPAGSAGDIVSMADYAATWQTYNVTVSANGSEKIGGIAQDATLSTQGQSVTFVYVDAVQGWVNTMDSTSNVRGTPPYPQATVSGACNTLTVAPCCANYKIATFLNPGTFCVSSVGGTPADDTADYLVVAGGASGAVRNPGNANGGGGAGGLRYSFATYTSPPSAPSHPIGSPTGKVLTVQGYPIVVGGGGAAVPALPSPTAARGNSGDTSSGLCISSAGGGGGGAGIVTPLGPGAAGGSGGGGGGGSPSGQSGGTGNTPTTSPAQGKDGGTAGPTSPDAQGGGGGGAIACGGASTPSANGAGGDGAGFTGAFGTAAGQPCGSYRYWAGGGGSSDSPSEPRQPGGLGGGGAGGQPGSAAAAGTANTGGGGGGGSATPPACTGASGGGGSGVVIIRYRFQ